MQIKEPLEIGETYHVMNKSIAGFKIYNSEPDYQRMLQTIEYFSVSNPILKFSKFLQGAKKSGKTFEEHYDYLFPKPKKLIKVIAYCLMPTHFHLVIAPLRKNSENLFVGNILNSYARYFNTKYERRGPLWVGRFKNVLVENDEQLWHLTRYVHLNPVTAHLREKPGDWKYSSYQEYIRPSKTGRKLCNYDNLLDVKPKSYSNFVEDQKDYQRELAQIKHLILE